MKKEMKHALIGAILTGIALLAAVVMMFKDDFAGPSLMLGVGMLAIFMGNVGNCITVKKRMDKHKK